MDPSHEFMVTVLVWLDANDEDEAATKIERIMGKHRKYEIQHVENWDVV